MEFCFVGLWSGSNDSITLSRGLGRETDKLSKKRDSPAHYPRSTSGRARGLSGAKLARLSHDRLNSTQSDSILADHVMIDFLEEDLLTKMGRLFRI